MNFIKTYWPGLTILILSIFIGISIYQDYGLSVDEYAQREIGTVNYNYTFKGQTDFINYYESKPTNFYTFKSRDHGPAFELLLSSLEHALNITNIRDIFLMRHITGYLLFMLCMFAGYVLMCKLFKDQFIACFAFLALIFEPRIFAHAFFNSKDIPSLSVFVLCMACCKWAFDENRLLPYLLLGILCGYGIAIRVPNMVIIAPIYLFFLADIINNYKQKKSNKIAIAGLTGFTVLWMLTTIAFWPLLWKHPVANFAESYQTLSRYKWVGNVLLNGTVYPSTHIPSTYIPIWFCITVPELILLLGFTGIVLVIIDFIRRPADFVPNGDKRNYLLFLYCFLTPVLMVIVLKSVVYDDWRHLYFIYPAFVFLGCYALSVLLKTRAAIVVKGLCIAQLAFIVSFMIRNHPFEHVYFNNLVSHKKDYLAKSYELDYWGNSYKAGLEWILKNDPSDAIYINNIWVLKENVNMLPEDQRKRIRIGHNVEECNYFLEHYRTVPFIFPKDSNSYDIEVLNSPILRVQKLK